jgi:hypothetical protein
VFTEVSEPTRHESRLIRARASVQFRRNPFATPKAPARERRGQVLRAVSGSGGEGGRLVELQSAVEVAHSFVQHALDR